MAEYIGILAFLICLIHFIYQAILLPSSRQKARDKLFILRDELRNNLLKNQELADKKTLRAYKDVDDGINRAIGRLHLLTVSNIFKVSKNSSKEKTEKFKKFHSSLESIEDKAPIDSFHKVNKVLERVFVLNSAMFILYLLPIVLTVSLISALVNRCKISVDYLVDICILKVNIKSECLKA